MKESELKALISLLEDDDPRVEEHVHNKLMELGAEAIPTLEAEWEIQDSEGQTRIEEMIHLIQSSGTISALRKWIAEGGEDLFEGWVLLTKYHFPELDFEAYRSQISRLVNRIWLDIRPEMNVTEKLGVINRMLYTSERFKPNRRSVLDPQNHYLSSLLDQKKGSPLSLGVLYLILADELKLPLQGIMLPGYFAITYHEADKQRYLDPFNQGLFFTRSDLTKYLEQAEIKEKAPYYQPASKVRILKGLLSILIEGHRRKKNSQKVKDLEKLKKYLDLDIPFEGDE